MLLLQAIFLKIPFFALQIGELPNPTPSTKDQLWGNYGIGDFFAANWFFIVAVILLLFLFIFYLKRERRAREEQRENQKRKQNN